MKLLFTPHGWDDYLYWQETDRTVLKRINELICDAAQSPFKGIGKPEPLRGNLSGWWSRRITGDHRLVYRVTGQGQDQTLEIVACRYHYG
ncbi:Txe/YoeB family addiction module toxin [Azospirillum sp. YIM DDC1]|uniref:Putative mRNA interferase YoeB n=1 Tax=Azospirillum aestuarii TaxID=2802052 RepID=A0ABS1HZ52_9PROT|nr:Txe/YoeB family addiction module toxin [Azospirillum aestuarii]MBK4720102.1 Txe/YoeB family addiction module toxin [Azospirillum aestuarii]